MSLSRQRVSSAHLLDATVVNKTGIGAGASDDEPRPEQLGRQLHLLVVYESCCRLQARGRGGGGGESRWGGGGRQEKIISILNRGCEGQRGRIEKMISPGGKHAVSIFHHLETV